METLKNPDDENKTTNVQEINKYENVSVNDENVNDERNINRQSLKVNEFIENKNF